MLNLDPQVQIKLMDISKEWAEKIADHAGPSKRPEDYPKEFDKIYTQLVKTICAK